MRFLSSIVFGVGAGGGVGSGFVGCCGTGVTGGLTSGVSGAGASGTAFFGSGEVRSGVWIGVSATSGFGGVVFWGACCEGTGAGTDWIVSVEAGAGVGGFGIISFWTGITGTSFSGFFGAGAGGVGVSSG